MRTAENEGCRTGMLLFAALLADDFIRPFGLKNEALTARTAVLCNLLSLVILLALFLPYSEWARPKPGKLTAFLLCGGLVVSTALEIRQGQRFYAYVMDRQLPTVVFLLLALLAALYASRFGLQALERAAGALLLLTAISIGILLLSVWPQLRFCRLRAEPVGWPQLAQETFQQLYIPPELVLLPLVTQKKRNGGRSAGILAGVFAASSAMSILGEMTLGAAYEGLEQPVYTIARLGGISVFRRLDAVHVGVWLLLFLLKISFYIGAFCIVWNGGGLSKRPRTAVWLALGASAAVLVALQNHGGTGAFLVQQALLIVGMLLVAIESIVRRKEQP